MPRTTSLIGAAGGLPGSAANPAVDPAWKPWLDLLEIALAEASHPAWAAIAPTLAERPAEAPLLDGASVPLDARRARDLMHRLADSAGILAVDAVDARELIRAAIARDHESMERAGERLGVSADVVAVLAQLVAIPLLHGCARALGGHIPRAWQRGYCPVCGAWPVLVEMRGIERDRRLRCGCCGADWSLPVLHCAFCDEVDHRRLGALVPEGEEQHFRIETCESCHGYLKAVTTLGALSARVLAVQDLATVALDLAAQDRGYARPSHPGWRPQIGLVA